MQTGDEVYWPGSDVWNIFGLGGNSTIMMLPEKNNALDPGPRRVSPKVGVEYTWLGVINMAPRNATAPGFFALTSAYSASQQFSKLTSGFEPLSNYLGSISFYMATLSGLLSVTDDTAGVCVSVSEGINCCVRQLPGLYAWLLGSSALGVWVESVRTSTLSVNIRETHVACVFVRIGCNSDTDWQSSRCQSGEEHWEQWTL